MEIVSDVSHFMSGIGLVLVKTLYPIYATYKAINSGDRDLITFWLIYWIVLSFLAFFETFAEPFLCFVPFYSQIRIILYIWLQIPFINGAIMIFQRVLNPFFAKNREILDAILPGSAKGVFSSFGYAATNLHAIYSIIYEYLDTID